MTALQMCIRLSVLFLTDGRGEDPGRREKYVIEPGGKIFKDKVNKNCIEKREKDKEAKWDPERTSCHP